MDLGLARIDPDHPGVGGVPEVFAAAFAGGAPAGLGAGVFTVGSASTLFAPLATASGLPHAASANVAAQITRLLMRPQTVRRHRRFPS